MRNQKLMLILVLCASLVFGVCGLTSAKKVTIRWATFLSGDQLEEMKSLIGLFEKRNPDIEVKIESYGDFASKFLTMFAAGVAPDVIHFIVDPADTYIGSGMLYDVTPLVRESGFKFDDYVPFAPVYKRGDKIWGGLETHFQIWPLYYNVDYFDQSGLPTPNDYYAQGRWDWSTFLQAARKLTVDSNGDGKIDRYGYSLFSPNFTVELRQWLLLNGACWINDKFNEVTIGSPEAIKALEFYIGLIWKDRVAPKLGAAAIPPGRDAFAAGICAMFTNGTWGFNHYQRFADFNWDVAHPPKGMRYATYREIGANGLICSQTKHPKEAWRLVEFFLGQEAQMANARSRLVVPVLKEALLSPEYMRRPPEHMKVIWDMVKYSQPTEVFNGCREVWEAIMNQLWPAIHGQRDVAVACKMAADAGNKALAKFLKR